MYLSTLGWDEGVAEFDRREGPGRDDVQRIFGQAPTCYGQPGSSWGPQSYGAMKKWGMGVYLDAGSHVGLDGKPCYYGGALNLYNLDHILRTDLTSLEKGADGRGPASPRPARRCWPRAAASSASTTTRASSSTRSSGTASTSARAPTRRASSGSCRRRRRRRRRRRLTSVSRPGFASFNRFPEVQFITASEAAKLYRDRSRGRRFGAADIKAVAAAVGDEIDFQRNKDYSAVRIGGFRAAQRLCGRAGGLAGTPDGLEVTDTPFGPTGDSPVIADGGVTTDWSQFGRTAADVADFVRKQHRVPGTVWLGSTPVSPEAYLRALAAVARDLADGKKPPETVELKPTTLAAAKYVSADDPKLWGWVIFPPGFRAPEMMQLAKRQAWTLKPALLDPDRE